MGSRNPVQVDVFQQIVIRLSVLHLGVYKFIGGPLGGRALGRDQGIVDSDIFAVLGVRAV